MLRPGFEHTAADEHSTGLVSWLTETMTGVVIVLLFADKKHESQPSLADSLSGPFSSERPVSAFTTSTRKVWPLLKAQYGEGTLSFTLVDGSWL